MQIWFHPARELEVFLKKVAKNIALDENFDPQMRPADPRFGDFQANGILPLAKKLSKNPRELAQNFVEAIKKDEDFDENLLELSVAGPGFINFKLSNIFLKEWLCIYKGEEELKTASEIFYNNKTVILDYPSPNTAKQMHVGHLRPMVIGEAINKLLRFCGANVICDNHIGDWGTNFGILILAIKLKEYKLNPDNENSLEDLENLYKYGSKLAKESQEIADKARAELVKLQNADPENMELWNQINKVSSIAFDKMYKLMGLTVDLSLGESFYKDKVERIYKELTQCQLAQESQNALVVFHEEHPRFKTQPFIIRKSDGASNYASTDLATILYRVETFKPDEIIYVTDARQQDHFQQLFLTSQKWFDKMNYSLPLLKHVWFGTILGEDGKAIKTKSGEPIRLKALIDEAVARAKKIVVEKNPDMPEDEIENIAQSVGLGALKYADLCQNRCSDYLFAWDKLLSFEGNTAPYLLYATARIHSIFRKTNLEVNADFSEKASLLETPQEIALGKKLLALPAVFDLTLNELRPHLLCTYLYELAGTFSSFYNANKVIVDEEDVKARRLMLCARTLEVLQLGLKLLGIKPLEKM